MSVINFVNCHYDILRATSWNKPVRVIGDDTRSGASKCRIGSTAKPNTYSVTFKFHNADDYQTFENWYDNTDMSGFFSFWLRKIDRVNGAWYAYRFVPGSDIQCNNPSGNNIECQVSLEELYARTTP